MKRLPNNHTKHTTTAIVLIAWLLTLVSGIANACLLEGAGRTRSHAADAEQSPPTKALCLDACDERMHSLVKQDVSVDQPHFAPITVIAFVWLTAQRMVAAARTQRDNRADLYDVPIRVQCPRLTLQRPFKAASRAILSVSRLLPSASVGCTQMSESAFQSHVCSRACAETTASHQPPDWQELRSVPDQSVARVITTMRRLVWYIN